MSSFASKYTKEQQEAFSAGKKAASKSKAKPRVKKSSIPRQPRLQSEVNVLHKTAVADAQEIHLSEGAGQYMHALADPINAPPCGLPLGGLSSEKNKCYIKGSMGTSAAGAGWILFSPGSMVANNSGTAASTYGVVYTTTANVGTPSTMAFTATPIASQVIGVDSNSPYAVANFSQTGVKFRLVSAEIRIRYIGTELNRGGSVIVFTDPNHNSLIGVNQSALLANQFAGRAAIKDGEWISCKYNGLVDSTEEVYSLAVTTGGCKAVNNCMGIMVQSAAVSQLFDFEAYATFEIIGTTGAGMTPNNADPTAFATINGSMQQSQAEHPGTHEQHSFLSGFIQKVGHGIQSAVSHVGPVLDAMQRFKTVEKFAEKWIPKALGATAKYGVPLALMAL